MEVVASQVERGMRLERPGWVHADDRSPVVVEVDRVEVKTREGGWKGMSLHLPFLETVIIRARIVRGEHREPTRITVPSTETFRLVEP